MRHIVETATGVYRPLSFKSGEMLHYILGLFVVIIATLVLAIPLSQTLLFFFMPLVVSLIPPLLERKKYGKLGKPVIALHDGALFIALPGDSRGCVSVPLADLRQVIAYGPEGRRRFRLIHTDGAFIEATPIWPRPVEEAAIRFLQRQVSAATNVIVKEPQSFFSYIRGEGP